MSHFNVSFIAWEKSQDSVHKPQFLGRERRAEADRTEVLPLTSLAPYRWTTPAHRDGRMHTSLYIPWHTDDFLNVPTCVAGIM